MKDLTTKTVTQVVAKRLHGLRKARNLSRMMVYTQSGVHWDILRRIETDERDVQLAELFALCELYGVEPVAILSAEFTVEIA